MTEDEARAWVAARWPSAMVRLDALAALVADEGNSQNLIASSTIPTIWTRHIVDSLQLLPLAVPGRWLDIGSGAGFPGLVIAAVDPDRSVMLVEPRRLRVEFLKRCARELSLTNVVIRSAKVQSVTWPSTVISARAVMNLTDLFAAACQSATSETVWLLPKGRGAANELAAARQMWQGTFHVEQSLTDPESSIIVARDVRARR